MLKIILRIRKAHCLIGSVLFVFSSALGISAPLPVLHPKVGSPVLQELMGGCSLRCAFFWETCAGIPGQLKTASELCDDDAMSAWISPAQGPGERIEFRIPRHLPKDCRDTPFYGLSIANGLIRSLPEFHDHARVKSMTLSINKRQVAELRLADTWRWQDFSFPEIFLNQGDVICLTINELYPGRTTQQPALTEIVLQGAH